MNVRPAVRSDCAQLLELMRGLAEFEAYLDDFRVTISELEKRGFPDIGEPEFHAVVAEQDDQLTGMLVYYFIPFTFDLRPTLFIKELYIDRATRNAGTGERLFLAVRDVATSYGCGRIKWDVLFDNEAAKRFYNRLGARQDTKWLGYVLEL